MNEQQTVDVTELMLLSDLAKVMRPRRCKFTLHRWARDGARPRGWKDEDPLVKLRTVGNPQLSCLQWIRDFFEATGDQE